MTNEWHPVTLPSLGRYYGDVCPDGDVEITPWTTAQEEHLMRYGNRSAKDRASLIDSLLQNNVRLPEGMAYEDLLTGDQQYLLVMLRALSLSPVYTVDYTCSCKRTSEISVDLTSLPVMNPAEGDAEPFEVHLPKCGKVVALRLARVKDDNKIVEYKLQKQAMQGMDDDSYRFGLARQLLTVDGESLRFDEKKEFVGGLVWLDLNVLTRTLEDNACGLVMERAGVCEFCGVDLDYSLPIQSGFFRPKRADIDAAIELARNSGA